jgi:threonine/homoserine/homoserine lactone efflux protein
MLATGVFLSDLLIALLCVFGFADFLQNPGFKKVYSLGASVVLILLGLRSINHPYKAFLKSYAQRVPSSGKNIWRGFSLNLINPFTFILWFNVLSAISVKFADTENNYKWSLLISLITILLVLFLMDVLKVFLSHLIGKRLNARLFYFLNRYFGIILLIIGGIFLNHFLSLMKVF